MKSISTMVTALSLLLLIFALPVRVHAGTVADIKEGSQKAARDIKKGAIEAGKATVETGKDIKAGAKKAWKEVKEGAKEVGRDFKKAYEQTRDAIRKEGSESRNRTGEAK